MEKNKIQLKALIKRNFIIKYRTKTKLLSEIVYPLIQLAILIVFKFVFQHEYLNTIDFKYETLHFDYDTNLDKFNLSITPINTKVSLIGDELSKLNFISNISYFENYDEMKNDYANNSNIGEKRFGIEFKLNENFPFDYTIVAEWNKNLFTNANVKLFSNGLKECRPSVDMTNANFKSCDGNQLIYDGFSHLQLNLNKIIHMLFSNSIRNLTSVTFMNMPKKEIIKESTPFITISSFYITLLYLTCIINLTTSIVAEREEKLKDVLTIAGVNEYVYLMSWTCTYLPPIVICNILLTVLLYAIQFYQTIQFTLIFFIMITLFSTSIISFAILISTFFSKKQIAGLSVLLIYFILALLYFILFITRKFDASLPILLQILISFSSPTAFSIGVDHSLYTDTKNLVRPDTMSILGCIIMLILDNILYIFLTVYFNNVLNNNCDKIKFWRKRDIKARETKNIKMKNISKVVEPVIAFFADKKSLVISDLEKKFLSNDGRKYNVINNLNLEIYSSQITAILGHNASGKTTILNILCGIIEPDFGKVFFKNYDLSSPQDLKKIREITGYCPQENILFEMLNIREHLELYSCIKNVDMDDMNDDIDKLLKQFDLLESQYILSKDLTDGQKRKLCLSIALIGDPEYLILDEPMNGMDTLVRYKTWEYLNRIKVDKTILLSTHFVEEAEFITDRKAVLCRGRIECCGSTDYLKRKVGLGYNLNITTIFNVDGTPNELTAFIKKTVPKAKLISFGKKEIVYLLPLSEISKYSELFISLEVQSKNKGVESFGVSVNTLEDAFLKIGEMEKYEYYQVDDEDNDDKDSILKYNGSETSGPSSSRPKERTLDLNDYDLTFLRRERYESRFGDEIFTHSSTIYALIKLRLLLLIRNKATFIARIIVPIMLVILSIFIPKLVSQPPAYDPNVIIERSLFEINEYSNEYSKFLVINKTNMDLENILNSFLIFNANEINQPIEYLNNLSDLNSEAVVHSGLVVNDTISNLVYIYNDTALLSFPYIINLVSNLYSRREDVKLTNVSIRSWPKLISSCESKNFDANSFSFLIILGLSFILSIASFAAEAVQDRGAQFAIILLTLIYMPCLFAFSMCLAYIFDKKETAFAFLSSLFTILFVVPFVFLNVLSNAPKYLHIIISLFDPVYGFIGSLSYISKIYMIESASKCSINVTNISSSLYFEFDIYYVPVSIFIGIFNLCLYSFIIYYVEILKKNIKLSEIRHNKTRPFDIPNEDQVFIEDSDVKDERIKIQNSIIEDCPLVVKELRKEFVGKKNVVAVRNLSVGFKYGEIFGLLGPNGSGKTTTLNLITNDLDSDSGLVKIFDHILNLKSFELFQNYVGFCPHDSTFWPEISLREHLTLYSIIKNVPSELIESECNQLIKLFDLDEHADKMVKNLSGGTKRKLSFLISLIGIPKILLLDEPTTGMDPKSKRIFRDLIKRIFKNTKKCAVVTTNSISEAENISDRIGIMSRGELKYLGSSDYLKEKLGKKYTFTFVVQDHLRSKLINATDALFFGQQTLIESNQYNNLTRYVYSVPTDCIKSLAIPFGVLEKFKKDGMLVEYSLSQRTVEETYIKLAHFQEKSFNF